MNLGLRVIGKRPDGFHDIETVFYPFPLRDALEAIPCTPSEKKESFRLTLTGLPLAGNSSENICFKAWQLIKNDFPDISPVHLYLHKAIPAGAGLGGGSADGAFTLRLLNELFRLNLSDAALAAYALRLGSDCPFFIANQPCLATGRGEIMKPVQLALQDYYFLLADPGVSVSTAWAFSMVKAAAGGPSPAEIVAMPVEAWKDALVNDFEPPVFAAYPELQEIKQQLYDAGAVYASMTGTGSCIYGIFNRKNANRKLPAGKYRLFNINADQ